MTLDSAFEFACPSCQERLTIGHDGVMYCVNWHEYQCVDGIWRLITPERQSYYAKFMREYELIREKEHRGSTDTPYYRNLPYGVTGQWADDWAIRAKSYETLIRYFRNPMSKATGYQFPTVLDLGAGNGWLSNQLSALDCDVVAVDLQTNSLDGLGAYIHYDSTFVPVQAEFDHLPFLTGQIRDVIFNASFHYSENYETTLREALRVLHSLGRLFIIDTPIYKDAASGQRMLTERQAHFEQTYGFRSDALRSEGYLTHTRLADLGKSLGITWRLIRPRYGIRWTLRRLIGRIRTRREPAEFYVILGTRSR